MIADAKTWIKLQVVNSASKTILLDTDWIVKYKADIMGSSRKLRFQTERRIIEVDMIVSEDEIVRDEHEVHMFKSNYDNEWHRSEPS